MGNQSKWLVTREEQQRFISALSKELAPLRAKLGISQGELASLVGISRQTYSAIECGKREMSWNTYLSLILFFDYNSDTHQYIRKLEAFPQEMFDRFNDFSPFVSDGDFSWAGQLGLTSKVFDSLDEQAVHSIRTMIMIEYARCTSTPGEVVVKSFDGVTFTGASRTGDKKATIALKAIKEGRQQNGE